MQRKTGVLKKVEDEIVVAKKKETKFVTSARKTQKNYFVMFALAREREAEMKLLKERDKTLDHNLESARK